MLRLKQTYGLTVAQPGTDTQLVLSLAEFPFSLRPPGKIVAISAQGASEKPSVSFNSKTCTVTYSAPPTDGESLNIIVTYDLTQ